MPTARWTHTFDPGAGVNSTVQSLALQTDGKVLVAGSFTTLGGQARNYVGRLENTGPATQNLAYDGATATWLRGGTSPEVWRTSFDRSIDGTNWVALGAGTRIPGGWQLTGVSVPPNSTLRARGFVAGGYLNSSGWFVESSVRTVAPILDIHTYAGLTIMGTVGVTYQIQYKTSLNNTNWTPLVDLMLPTNPYLYVDTNSPATGQRFYRAVFTNSVPMP